MIIVELAQQKRFTAYFCAPKELPKDVSSVYGVMNRQIFHCLSQCKKRGLKFKWLVKNETTKK